MCEFNIKLYIDMNLCCHRVCAQPPQTTISSISQALFFFIFQTPSKIQKQVNIYRQFIEVTVNTTRNALTWDITKS